MNYSTLVNVGYSILWLVLGLIMNATKEPVIKLFSDYNNISNVDIRNIFIFFIALTISILLAVNKFFEIKKKENKKNSDLFPYFTKEDILEDTKYYIGTKIQNVPPSQEDEPIQTHAIAIKQLALPFFFHVFEKETHRYYIVLAGSGMGKTTFMINLYLRYVNQQNPEFSIKLIPLNSLDGLSDIKEMSAEEKSNTILLLDSLDEDPKAIANYKERLESLLLKVWRFRQVVITCRTQFFPNEKEEPHEILIPNPRGGNFHFKKIYISPFDVDDCKKYLNKKYGLLPSKRKEKALAILENAQQVMVRPMLLSRIDDLLELDEGKSFNQLYNIYELIVEKWIQREGDKQVLTEQKKEKFKADLRDFSNEVARRIYRNWNSSKIAQLSKEEIDNIVNYNELDLKEWEITGKSLLNRDAAGNWKFAHKSIWEYYIAKRALHDEEFRKNLEFKGMDFAEKLFLERAPQQYFINIKYENPSVIIFYNSVKKRFTIGTFKRVSGLVNSKGETNLNISKLIESKEVVVNLKEIIFYDIPIRDISSLKGLSKLEVLNLANTQVYDFEVLKSFLNLRHLDLSYLLVSDISFLSDLKKIETINLTNARVNDISYLRYLKKIKKLNISHSYVTNISMLKHLHSLEELDLSHTKIEDLSPLENLEFLISINISSSRIKSIEPLLGIVSLKTIFLSKDLEIDKSEILDFKSQGKGRKLVFES